MNSLVRKVVGCSVAIAGTYLITASNNIYWSDEHEGHTRYDFKDDFDKFLSFEAPSYETGKYMAFTGFGAGAFITGIGIIMKKDAKKANP